MIMFCDDDGDVNCDANGDVSNGNDDGRGRGGLLLLSSFFSSKSVLQPFYLNLVILACL